MVDLSIYQESICKFLTDAIIEFKESEGSLNSVAIFWNQEEETIYLSFNKTKTIEEAKRSYEGFEKVKIKQHELSEVGTKEITNNSAWTYKTEKLLWEENPYRKNLNYLFRGLIVDCILEVYQRDDYEILLQLQSGINEQLPIRFFCKRDAQLGRFIIDKLRDAAYDTIGHYDNQKEFSNEEEALSGKFLQSLSEEQKVGFNKLMENIIDYKILNFLNGVDESFWDEYDGVKFQIGNREIKNKETEEGGFMQEFFHWRNKYSRHKNF